MRGKKCILILALLALPLSANKDTNTTKDNKQQSSTKQHSGQPDGRQIVATGYGSSKAEARDNAFSAAIEKYVGIVVDSEALLQNGSLVKDDVLTASNGYVKSYKILSKEKFDGIWEVKVDALIRTQKVFGKEKGVNTAILSNKNSSNLENTYARVSTKIKSKKDASKILSKKFKDLFMPASIKALIDVESVSATLEEDHVREDRIPLTVTHHIRINPKVYRHRVEALEQLFFNLGLRKRSNVDHPYVQNDMLKIKNTQAVEQLKRTDIGIIKPDGAGYKLDVWSFPRHWKDVYPFTSTESIIFNDFFDLVLRVKRKSGGLLFSDNISTELRDIPALREIAMLTAFPNSVRGTYNRSFKRNRAKIITPLFGSKKVLEFKTVKRLSVDDAGDLGTFTLELKEK